MIPIKYNTRYLIRRWKSTLSTALTFALVVVVFLLVMSLARGLESAFVSTGDPLNVLIMRPGVQSEMQSSIQLERYQILRNFRGVERDAEGQPMVAPEVVIIANKPKAADGKPTNLTIRGVHRSGIAMRPQVTITEGRMFKPGLREVIVSKNVSQRFAEMKLGDSPNFGKGTWTIVGVFDAQRTAYDSEVWADYQELMQEFDRDEYSSVLMRAIDPAAVESIIEKAESDPRLKLEGKDELAYYEAQTTSARPVKAFGQFLALIMSIGACFSGMNTMYSNIANRVKEIGTLRILGFTPVSVLISFLFESVVLAMVGGVIGCGAGWVLVNLLPATGTTNFQTFSEVLFHFTITPDLIAQALGFAAFMGFFGGLLPSFAAARQPIIRTLRQI